MEWLRLYNDITSNRKVRAASRALKMEYCKVLGCWVCVLVACNQGSPRGDCTDYTAADLAQQAGIKIETAKRVLSAFIAARLLSETQDGRLLGHGWSDRQYASDQSSERVRKYRKRKKNELLGNGDETLQQPAAPTVSRQEPIGATTEPQGTFVDFRNVLEALTSEADGNVTETTDVTPNETLQQIPAGPVDNYPRSTDVAPTIDLGCLDVLRNPLIDNETGVTRNAPEQNRTESPISLNEFGGREGREAEPPRTAPDGTSLPSPGRRANGTNPRALGTSLRDRGLNPRARHIPLPPSDPPAGSPDALRPRWEAIREEVGEGCFRTWISPLQVAGIDGAQATILAPSKFHAAWIDQHHRDTIARHLGITVQVTADRSPITPADVGAS